MKRLPVVVSRYATRQSFHSPDVQIVIARGNAIFEFRMRHRGSGALARSPASLMAIVGGCEGFVSLFIQQRVELGNVGNLHLE